MVRFARSARRNIQELARHYARLERGAATAKLAEAVTIAAERIEKQAGRFWDYPRPYPELAENGRRWLKVGRYWFAFRAAAGGYAITGVVYDSADIPNRI